MVRASEAVDTQAPQWLQPHPWVSARPEAAPTELATELATEAAPTKLATELASRATRSSAKAAPKAQLVPTPQLAAARARLAPPPGQAGGPTSAPPQPPPTPPRAHLPTLSSVPSSPGLYPCPAQSRLVFSASSEAPTHECGFSGMQLGERAGIETAEQAVRAVMLAQARGGGQLPPEERTPLPQPRAAVAKPAAASRRAREEPAASRASEVPLSHSAAWRASQRTRAEERRRKEEAAPAVGAPNAEESAADEGTLAQYTRGMMDDALGAMDRMTRWFTG